MTVGYKAATMDGIAASFGSSKSTIYRRYGSKAGLLKTAMKRGVPLLASELEKVDAGLDRPPEAVLRDFGLVIQQYNGDPNIRALWRAVSEARDELGEALHGMIGEQARALAPIADYLAKLARAGELRAMNPQAAAAAFSNLVSGGLTRFLGVPPDAAERSSLLETGLSLFLDGLRTRR